MSRATSACECCGGTGREPIAPQRQRVLDAARARGEASPSDVTDALDGVGAK